jgi:hypothetical protein
MNRYETLAVRCAGLALAAALTLNGEMLRAQTAAGAAEAGGTVANGNNTAATNNTSPKSDNTTPAPDPREGLKPGWYDAGEASLGMEHLVFLKKPDAFQPPASKPTDSPMQKMFAQLGFANSDLAFEGTTLFQGNFYGINFYDISDPGKTSLITSLVCPGGQGDVSVYGHLLFMSVEMPNGRIDCGTQGFPPPPPPAPGHEHERRLPPADPARFRGVRIFDITDLKNPKQVAAVQTCRGSHTHTLLVDPNDKDNIYVYVSGTSFVRQKEELADCSGEAPDKNPNTSLFRIDVIQVPLAHPEDAKIVSSPRVFLNAQTGAVNGLNNGGSHDHTAPVDTNQCHDITIYSAIGLAAGACEGNGILLDIRDPVHPVRVDAVNDRNYSYWHSATFSNDGTKVVFTDEWGGGLQPRCRATDPKNWGADAVFDLKDGKLHFESYYKMPAAQTETENCVAHNGSLIPVPGRDIEVQAWYQGGISIMDFTDAAKPYEIGYYDRGPIDAKQLILGGDWSAYWYNGYIYGSEIARGLDVFQLTPTPNLTQHEIDAAKLVHFDTLNVQDQPQISWPNSLVVAQAYLDQLARSQALPAKQIAALSKQIDKAERSHLKAKDVAKLGKMAPAVTANAAAAKDPADAKRMTALAGILEKPVA